MPDDSDARRLRIVLTDAQGRPARAGALASWLRTVAPARAGGSVTIAFVSDAAMRRLNKQFAGKDKATDVLSFRTADGATAGRGRAGRGLADRAGRGSEDPRYISGHLGDIVIATGVARRQAREAGHSYARELRMLALHGFLHLLGYDHETDNGTMARVEARLRRKGGLGVGVIERAGSV
jgi:probable rRNA maturation factor